MVEPSLKNYEGCQSLNQGDHKNSSLSNLIGILDIGNKDENQSDLTMQQINAQNQLNFNNNSDQLVEIQDQVQMFENLKLKNEFIRSMRNYTLMVFSSGDFNKIKQLMMKYSLIEGKQSVKSFKMNKEETITQLLGYFDIETC